jgi:hypothetical protein
VNVEEWATPALFIDQAISRWPFETNPGQEGSSTDSISGLQRVLKKSLGFKQAELV